MNSMYSKIAVFFGLMLLTWMVGGMIIYYTVAGIITLLGLIFLIESIGPLKWLVEKSSKFLDVIIFGFTIYASISLSVTVAMSLTVAGLGFTLVYAPLVRHRAKRKQKEKQAQQARFDRLKDEV